MRFSLAVGCSSAVLLACGSDPVSPSPGGDAGVLDSSIDQLAPPPDGASLDAPPVPDSGAPYLPSKWSQRFEHAKYAHLFDGGLGQLPCVAAILEGFPGIDFGQGPQAKAGICGYLMGVDTGTVCGGTVNNTLNIWQVDPPLIRDLNEVSPYGPFNVLGNISKSGQTTNSVENRLFPVGVAHSVPFDGRLHAWAFPNNNEALAYDSAALATLKVEAMPDNVPPGGLAMRGLVGGTTPVRVWPGPVTTPSIAVDILRAVDATTYYVAGRLAGPSFDFKDGKTVAGAGMFLSKMTAGTIVATWVTLFGGVPQEDPSLGAGDHFGAGARFDPGTKVYVTTFEGTSDFGTGPQTSPAGVPSVAVALMDLTTGKATKTFVFPKGPGSHGRISRPSVAMLKNGDFLLFDTLWDTVDVGGVKLQAQQGADVYVARFDATGKGLWGRVYGGAGDDEAFLVLNKSGTVDDVTVLSGHSMQSIDFGNGPLTTSAVEGEAWVTRLSL